MMLTLRALSISTAAWSTKPLSWMLCLVVILAGCASSQTARTKEHLDIMEAVFREICKPAQSSKENGLDSNRLPQVYFLGVGTVDASPELLQRLNGLPAPAKPASAGRWNNGFIYDRSTGALGFSLRIRRITKITEGECEVEVEKRSGGGLDASGTVYRVIRKEGRWIVTGKNLKWES